MLSVVVRAFDHGPGDIPDVPVGVFCDGLRRCLDTLDLTGFDSGSVLASIVGRGEEFSKCMV